MDEHLKKDIRICIERIEEKGFSGELAAAFASEWLNKYPELSELLDVIASARKENEDEAV